MRQSGADFGRIPLDITTSLIDGLPALNVLTLCLATLAVSFAVSAIGPTGGMQMAAVAATMPAGLLIPLHAWITGFSALFRALGLRREIDWRFVGWFVPASAAAALPVAGLVVTADFTFIQATVALYILASAVLMVARPQTRLTIRRRRPVVFGLVTGALSMIIGATGPLLMTLMHGGYEEKTRLSATFSACLTFQHLSKIVLFGLIGVSLLGYPVILALTLVAAAVGTLMGRRLLIRLPERLYRLLLAAALAAVSAALLISLIF